MNKVVMKIDGMSCGMCESHVCEAIRKAAGEVAKVSASHKKGVAELTLEGQPDVAALKAAVNETGYRVLDVKVVPAEKKKGRFSFKR